MKKLYPLLLSVFSFAFFNASAQNIGTVSGKLVDSVTQQILKGATLSILNPTDSSVITNQVSGDDGIFLISNLALGNYILKISFEGYKVSRKRITITQEVPNAAIGKVYLRPKDNELETVVVEASPIKMKKDTVEFNAGSFATKPNAVAEDLLKKLPGVQVDAGGTITAQGEKVTRVLVDGKRFFSDDPKLATRNLPPDVIDKIQVFDDLSDQSKFTGFDDGNRVKTINITTKKNMRKGYFGKVVAGVGNNEDYDESVNMHRFDGDRQISLLAQANDLNKQNFTIQDVLGSAAGGGGGGRRGGGGAAGGNTSSSPGITTVAAVGTNYKDAWGKNTDAYGSYFYNDQHVTLTTHSTTVNTNPSDTTFFNSASQSANISRSQNHRVAFNIEHRFDSSNSLIFRPNISFQTTTPNGTSSTMQTDNLGNPVTNTNVKSSSYNTGYSLSNTNLQLRHKFAKPFRTISLDMGINASGNDGDGLTYTINNKFRQKVSDTLNQYYTDSFHSVSINPTLSYTEPIGKNQILEFNYSYTYNHNTSINNTYDYNLATKGFSNFDSLFSNSYKFTSNSNRFSLNYRIQNTKYNLSLGTGIQLLSFDNLNTTKNIRVAHDYTNFTPTLNFQYTFSRTSNLRLNYSGRTGTPTATQLQPLTTTTDNLNFQVGNPNLKPQFIHSLRALYSNFDAASGRVFFATINASATENDIQSAVTSNKTTGGRTTTYVNLDGTYNIGGFANYGFALKKPKSNLNFITNFNYSQSQSLQRDSVTAPVYKSVYIKNTNIGETVSWTTNIKKNFDMNLSLPFNYTIANNSTKTLHYFTQGINTELTAYTNSGWLFAANFDYTLYGGNRGTTNPPAMPIFSPSIAKQLFKKKNGELRLSVFDLFDKNQSPTTNISQQQVTTTYTNVLSRYAMLTFTFNLNNFGQNTHQKRFPGMPPGMRGPGGNNGGGFGGGRRGGGGGGDF
jgi:hypothetical protein